MERVQDRDVVREGRGRGEESVIRFWGEGGLEGLGVKVGGGEGGGAKEGRRRRRKKITFTLTPRELT